MEVRLFAKISRKLFAIFVILERYRKSPLACVFTRIVTHAIPLIFLNGRNAHSSYVEFTSPRAFGFPSGTRFRLDAGSIVVLALQFEFCGRIADLAISKHNRNLFNKLCKNAFLAKKKLLQRKLKKEEFICNQIQLNFQSNQIIFTKNNANEIIDMKIACNTINYIIQ